MQNVGKYSLTNIFLGLERKPFVKLSGLGTRINTPQTRDLISRLNLAAITVLNNKK